MAAILSSRKRCAGAFLDEPLPAPPHLAKRGRFSPAPAAFAAHQQQALAAASAATAEAAALREENGTLRARAEALERDNSALKRDVTEQHRPQEALERDSGVLKHRVAALHRREEVARCATAESKAREEEAKREAAELRKKVAELEAANYALAARMLGTDSCRFQAVVRCHNGGDDPRRGPAASSWPLMSASTSSHAPWSAPVRSPTFTATAATLDDVLGLLHRRPRAPELVHHHPGAAAGRERGRGHGPAGIITPVPPPGASAGAATDLPASAATLLRA